VEHVSFLSRFLALSRLVRVLWLFAAIEALSLAVRLIASR